MYKYEGICCRWCCVAITGVPREAEGASRPGRHFRRGGIFVKNVKIYVKTVKCTLKKGTILSTNGQKS